MEWITGNEMCFDNFAQNQPDGNPYSHLDYNLDFGWNAKDDANDQDNGFICKRPIFTICIFEMTILIYSIKTFFSHFPPSFISYYN